MRDFIFLLLMAALVLTQTSCKSDLTIEPEPSSPSTYSEYAEQVQSLLAQATADELELLSQEEIKEFEAGPDLSDPSLALRSDISFRRKWHAVLSFIYCNENGDVIEGIGPWYGRRNAHLEIDQSWNTEHGLADGKLIFSDVDGDDLYLDFIADPVSNSNNGRLRQHLLGTAEHGTGIFYMPGGTLHFNVLKRSNAKYPIVVIIRGWILFGDNGIDVPLLTQPERGDIMDNGCIDHSDIIEWKFDWEDFPGATEYHIYVRGADATIPLVDDVVTTSEFIESGTGYIADFNRIGWYWHVRAKVDGSWTDWSETWTFDVEPLNTDCPIPAPALVKPDIGDVLDNGCSNATDMIEWTFDWEDVPNATMYHIYVRGANATYPVVDQVVNTSDFTHSSLGYIINDNRLDWYWHVKVNINGVWSQWSETRTFNVEPLNTDCP